MSSQSEIFLTRLKEIECPDSTYAARNPALVMKKALGSIIEDADGQSYIDFVAGFGVLSLGHNPEPLRKTLARRCSFHPHELPPITHGLGDVFSSVAKVEVMETLLSLLPSHFKRLALALTGSQAVEIAIKTSILATKRCGFLVFENSYHGVELGVLPLTSLMNFKAPFTDFLPEGRVESIPFGANEEQLMSTCAKLAAQPCGLAAIVVEPIQGRAGVILPPPGWLKLLRKVADRFGALLIFDEIFIGLGRVGRMTFADEVACDLLCLGKAIGGGLPLSACIGTAEVMLAWPESTGEALHTGTFFGHPLTCEVANETLQEIKAQNLTDRARVMGNWSLEWLKKRLAHHSALKDIRGMGLMMALDFKSPGAGVVLMEHLRRHRLITLASGSLGESLTLTPPLNISQDVLEEGLKRIVRGLDEIYFKG